MNVTFSNDELEFRSEVRSYFENEFPQDILAKQRKAIPLSRDDVADVSACNRHGLSRLSLKAVNG